MTLGEELANHYIGFIKIGQNAFPNVDVYAEKGSGLETLVGTELPDLTVGQVLDLANTTFYTRDGDHNQEDITNDAIQHWAYTTCYHFSLTDTVGGDHFDLPGDPNVLNRLVFNMNQPKSVCP